MRRMRQGSEGAENQMKMPETFYDWFVLCALTISVPAILFLVVLLVFVVGSLLWDIVRYGLH